MFHCVDLDWRADGYIFQFSPKYAEEAECRLFTLYPYVKGRFSEYADSIDQYFTPDCIARCRDMEYDPFTDSVKMNNDFEFEIDLDVEDRALGFDLNINAARETQETRPDFDRAAPNPRDDDSVSTLGANQQGTGRFSSMAPGFIPNPEPRTTRMKGTTDQVSVVSSTSTVTMETNATVESQLMELRKEVQQTKSQFALILEKLDSNAQATKASSPDVARTQEAGGTADAEASSNELQ